jgi:hypothetical protein
MLPANESEAILNLEIAKSSFRLELRIDPEHFGHGYSYGSEALLYCEVIVRRYRDHATWTQVQIEDPIYKLGYRQ